MKKIIIISIISIFFLFPILVNATIDAVINGQGVRIRSTPDATNDTNIIAETTIGTLVTLVDTTKYTGEGCTEGWYKLIYNEATGYVCSKYISTNINPEYNTSGWTARTNGNFINVRNAPSSSSTIQNTLILGVNLTILENYPSGNGCDNNWYKVKYYDGKSIGYVCSDYVFVRNNITDQDLAFESTLRTLGFPESYFPYLSYLHKKYPTWTFNPIMTNLNWNDVLFGELGRNYISSNNEFYLMDNTIVEVPNWKRANTGVISFYMDPRNFLNEKYMFMFEALNFDNAYETSYPNIVKTIFEGGTFSNDEFANLLTSSGKLYNVSPTHLASRIKQEVTSSGNNATNGAPFEWAGVTYSGIYNFFNIGAYGADPQLRGLAYAAGVIDNNAGTRQPWNTIEKAINGGTSILSSKYIASGQYTLYFQKFNTSPTSIYSSYTHQYMTNVQAPSSEALSIYKSLSTRNMLSNPYTFSIPVYKNMPISTSLPSSGSKNNNLSDISINNISIFGFDKDVLEYTYFVDKTLTSITVKGTAENSLSLVNGDGNISITNDTNQVSIVVTAENGEIKTYKVNIIKVESIVSIIELNNKLGVKNTDVIPNNSINTTLNTLITKIMSNSPSSIITVSDSNGIIIDLNGLVKTGQLITVKTTTNETKTYKVSVTGDTDGDGAINILDLLKIQRHLVKAKALESSQLVAADTNSDSDVNILDLLRIQKHILGELNL